MIKLDKWQEEILKIKKGNLIILGGRQIGKSEVIAELEANYLIENPKSHLLIVSGVERQASGLFQKIIQYVNKKDPKAIISHGKKKQLKTTCWLTNGSIMRTEPVGTQGAGARQHTVTRIVFEEMQLIPEDAFAAITPMLLTTGGDIHMLGTAWATEGYVYDRLSDTDFSVFRIDAEDVAEKRKEPEKSIMLKFLEKERKRLTEAQYMQEYKAIPSDRARQIFPDALIKKCQKVERKRESGKNCAIGVDPAGLGEDEGAITIVQEENNQLRQIELIITKNTLTTEIVDRIVALDQFYKAQKIYVDDGGVGFGVFSGLMINTQTKRKTVALNNASRSLDTNDEKRKKILKEDLYTNLLYLMERGQIDLLMDPEIRESLKSCKFEYSKDGKKLKITSNYNHPTEALTRAAWFLKDKKLNIWVR